MEKIVVIFDKDENEVAFIPLVIEPYFDNLDTISAATDRVTLWASDNGYSYDNLEWAFEEDLLSDADYKNIADCDSMEWE